jgi:TonB family protein
MLKSTGHQILDDAVISAFLQWRFKPGTPAKVEIPLEFVSRGTPAN